MNRYAANELGEVQRDQMKMRFVHQIERHKILVMFEKNPKVGKKEIERTCERMGEDKRCVVILDGNVSPPAKIQIDGMQPDIMIEIFKEEQLLVNITEHRLVPLHQPLTAAQKEAVLARYKVKDTQLPRMELNDPIARYFGLQRGDVVKITRSSETAGRYTTYRLVV
jgi:DNA-directed RNA polymerase I, II, and III subunit RPABC1